MGRGAKQREAKRGKPEDESKAAAVKFMQADFPTPAFKQVPVPPICIVKANRFFYH